MTLNDRTLIEIVIQTLSLMGRQERVKSLRGKD